MHMPVPRVLPTARTTAAANVTVLKPRAKAPRPPPRLSRQRSYAEKTFISGVVVFIAILLVAGIIYAGMNASAPESSDATLQRLPLPRIARIVLPGPGSMCRELLFDNDTGIFSNDRLRPCDEKPSSGTGLPTDSGLSSFREAFSKRP